MMKCCYYFTLSSVRECVRRLLMDSWKRVHLMCMSWWVSLVYTWHVSCDTNKYIGIKYNYSVLIETKPERNQENMLL